MPATIMAKQKTADLKVPVGFTISRQKQLEVLQPFTVILISSIEVEQVYTFWNRSMTPLSLGNTFLT